MVIRVPRPGEVGLRLHGLSLPGTPPDARQYSGPPLAHHCGDDPAPDPPPGATGSPVPDAKDNQATASLNTDHRRHASMQASTHQDTQYGIRPIRRDRTNCAHTLPARQLTIEATVQL